MGVKGPGLYMCRNCYKRGIHPNPTGRAYKCRYCMTSSHYLDQIAYDVPIDK